MRVFTEQITPTATLTGYVQDASAELAGTEMRPAVLVLPGGGYRYCSDREAEPIALAYLAEGFNAFVLRYATGEHPWEDSRADGVAGLEWVRDHAAENGTDPAQVAVVGFSAGGHLAATLGVSAPRRPDALVLGYPVTLASLGPYMGKRILDTVEAVDDATPPAFVFSTQGDETVPVENTLDFCSALARRRIPFEAHVYLLGPHGISLAKPLTASGRAAMVDADVAAWLPDSVRFLRQVFGDFPVQGEPQTFATFGRG
ncbi:alpha/beta hydrolase [Propioniciclava coleopterorum]|nr:alpha/beta hydrolase [Propioniciclava coleopterorum]